MEFEWDKAKETTNIEKHGVSFDEAIQVFDDPNHLIAHDTGHSQQEARWLCFGKVDGEIMTVRFTYRGSNIRIIGAAYWRKGKKLYEKKWRH